SLASAPLFVGDILRDELFAKKDAVILTSATLTTGGRFDYVKQRLGLAEASELALGSPFDYRRAALILLPSDMPEPNGRGYAQAVERAIVDLCRASGGRALALFTSHAALRAARRAVREPLAREEITVLAQGVDGTPRELLNRLKSEPRTVVLGTASFWEGVDVVGEALSLLIIAKLPFSVPTEPIFAARSQHFEEPFLEYALPQAVLRFKQGFGRLIRQKTDRGALVVLDRRLRSKAYGRLFLESLPACTVREARLAALPDYVARWLGGEAPA
ncbi:MAG TPA: helicase C-terminal domain-containing protein, partial [Dehalococcoidia bacterium]